MPRQRRWRYCLVQSRFITPSNPSPRRVCCVARFVCRTVEMKVLSLISGGKDSCYCMLQCLAAGHEIVALGNLQPVSGVDEMDSFMYQTVGHEVISLIAEAMSLPLFRRETKGIAVAKAADYTRVTEDEVEDLLELLKTAKDEIHFDAVSSGAIMSNYQRVRVENVCSRLGLVSLAYLWRRDQTELLSEMISCEIDAVVVKVASLGLEPKKVLNSNISEMFQHFVDISKKYELNVCGEGGEYETLTLDCPLFKKKIEIVDSEIVIDDSDECVGFVKIKKAILVDKKSVPDLIFDRIKGLKGLKSPIEFVNQKNCVDNSPTNKFTDFVNYNVTNSFTSPSVSNTKNYLWISNLCGKCDTMIESTVETMSILKLILEKHSMNFKNIKVVNVFLNSMKNYVEFNEIYKKCLNLNPPVRACVEVNLPKNVLFFMDCICHVEENVKTMHVQSISHWAPANIGPYSQAIETGDSVYTAGQIALVPGSMELINCSVNDENELIFRHISRVLKGFDCNLCFDDVFIAMCYSCDENFVVKAANIFDKKILVVSVGVNGLPRGANIEWQVVARKIKGDFDNRILTSSKNSLKVEFVSYKCDFFSYYLISFETEDCNIDVFQCDDVFDELKLVMSDREIKHVRGFFKPNDCDGDCAFYEKLLKCFDSNPSVAVVPVTKFATVNCRLILLIQSVEINS